MVLKSPSGSSGGAVAGDCSGVTWTNNYTTLSDLCGETGATTVEFYATDACGNTSTTSATLSAILRFFLPDEIRIFSLFTLNCESFRFLW
mgnify:CR=1 FL=1